MYWRDMDPVVLEQIDAERARTGYPSRLSVLRKVMMAWAQQQVSQRAAAPLVESTGPQLVRAG